MQEKLAINAKVRKELGKPVENLRKAGFIPAVLYGRNTKSIPLSVDQKEFIKVFEKSGESTLINLQVDSEKPRKVLIHDVQHHFLTNDFIHVDFYEVDMSKKIKTGIALVFEGESKAVKDLGGVLVKNIAELEVEALPADLPHDFKVDISKLDSFEDVVLVSDIKVDESKVKILADPKAVVAKVAPPRTEEELKQLEEKPAEEVTAVEGVEKQEGAEEEQAPTETKEEKTESKKEKTE